MSTRLLAAIGTLVLVLGAACSAATAPAPPNAPSAGESAAPRSSAPPGSASGSPSSASDASQQAQALPSLDRMIVRNVSLTLVVANVAETYRHVEQVAAEYGGFVASSQFRQEGDRPVASVTIRVPADGRTYQVTLDRLRGLADRVLDEKGDVQDATEEHVDLESRVRNLRATERSLLTLYDRAQRLEDVFTVQRELTTIRGQIEQAEGRKRALERRAGMATIAVQLREASVLPPRPREWSALEVAGDATEALGVVTRRLVTVGIWLAVWLPLYGVPLLALLLWRSQRRPATR